MTTVTPTSASPLDPHWNQASDWTDLYDRTSIIRLTNDLIDDLILEIHGRKLDIHKGLDTRELALLYRFPIHVGVNIFVERLLRVADSRQAGWRQTYPEVSYKPIYYKDTDTAVMSYYYNFAMNYDLLHRIYRVLGGPTLQEKLSVNDLPKPQDYLLYKPFSFIEGTKQILKSLIEGYVKLSKPDVVGEYSNWMRDILPLTEMLSFDFPVRHYPDDNVTRSAIRNGCRTVFLLGIDRILGITDDEKNKLSVVFSDFIDHIIPQSVVEGLSERFAYFEELIKNWKVKQVHSFVGYYYNENFKIFAILAHRKGALLIGHQHGASNPMSSYKQYKNELAFLDCYFTWGICDSSWMKLGAGHDRPKMYNLGSAYLSSMKPWKKAKTTGTDITLLYPSGPLTDFVCDLQEIITEKNYRHRLDILRMLKELRKSHPRLKILYKPFPGTFTNDPIKSVFADEFREGMVELIHAKPSSFYRIVDVVLWDTVSTGFCESLAACVPTLVFQSLAEYEQSVPFGKELDEKMKACGLLFHQVESGLQSFRRIFHDPEKFMTLAAKTIHEFQRVTAYPVSRNDYKKQFSSVIVSLTQRN